MRKLGIFYNFAIHNSTLLGEGKPQINVPSSALECGLHLRAFGGLNLHGVQLDQDPSGAFGYQPSKLSVQPFNFDIESMPVGITNLRQQF